MIQKILDFFDNAKKELRLEIVALINQIQELKAINNYQTFELEQKIKLLEKQAELRLAEIIVLEREIESHKFKPSKVKSPIASDDSKVEIIVPKVKYATALDGSFIEIIDHGSKK